MKRSAYIITCGFLATLFLSQTAYAADCTTISTQEKLQLKILDIRDRIMIFFLMNPIEKITYRQKRADELYQQAMSAPTLSLAYTEALRAEDNMTRLVADIRILPTTEGVNMDSLEQSIQGHERTISAMKTGCDWNQISQFIQKNWFIARQLYFERLPTDKNQQLFWKGN